MGGTKGHRLIVTMGTIASCFTYGWIVEIEPELFVFDLLSFFCVWVCDVADSHHGRVAAANTALRVVISIGFCMWCKIKYLNTCSFCISSLLCLKQFTLFFQCVFPYYYYYFFMLSLNLQEITCCKLFLKLFCHNFVHRTYASLFKREIHQWQPQSFFLAKTVQPWSWPKIWW